jgi:acyl-coenzyme A thioesterase PaaI-like protein
VHVMFVDMLAGFVADQHSGEDWVFTTDLSSCMPVGPVPERIDGRAHLLRTGRSIVTAEVNMVDPAGRPVGYGVASFTRMPSRHGDPPKPQMSERRLLIHPRPLDVPLATATGIEVVDPAAGRVIAPIRDDLRNPAGAMQGAMVALVGERAAQALAEHAYGEPAVVTDLDVRYLAMGRTGPVVSEAGFVGDPAAGAIQILLRDTGHGDRVMTALKARVVPVG